MADIERSSARRRRKVAVLTSVYRRSSEKIPRCWTCNGKGATVTDGADKVEFQLTVKRVVFETPCRSQNAKKNLRR